MYYLPLLSSRIQLVNALFTQQLLIWLLRVLGPRWRLHPIVAAYLAHSLRIGKSPQLPSALVPLAARLWARGWFNRQFLDTHRHWILPYWATRQLDPADRGFVGRALLPVLINSGYRNWTAIGNPGSQYEAIVDPRGLITPQPNEWGWSFDVWLAIDGQCYFPSRLADNAVSQQLRENLPIVQTMYEPSRLRVMQEAFAAQDERSGDWVILRVMVENPRGEARQATLYLTARPFNPEGVAIVHHVEFRAGEDDTCELWLNDTLAAYLPKPDGIACANELAGDLPLDLAPLNRPIDAPSSPKLGSLIGQDDDSASAQISSPAGVATAMAAYRLELRPHSHQTVTAALPMTLRRGGDPQAARWTKPEVAFTLQQATSARWRELLAQGMRISVPDERVQNAFEANKAHLLILHDGDSITPGPFLYHEFWFRDAAFMLHALDQLGYHEQVKQVLAQYPRRLRKDGYYLAQEGEWDANGQALWTLAEHTRLSGDLELLARQYWQVLNAAHWIDAARQKTKRGTPRAPEHGLLPAGLSAEHLGPNDFYFWDDFWGLAGLAAAVYAASIFGQPGDEAKLRAAYDAFAKDVDAALDAVAARTGARWMPASPYRNADSAMVANLIAVYPLQLFTPDDPRIVATLDELERIAFVDGAFFHNVGHAGFGTYLALQIAGCLLYQRKREAWAGVRWLLDHASPTFTWPEAIHPLTRRGGHGDGQHGWASADFVSFIRNALLFEEQDHLVITPALPEEWVFETASIKVERAPTHFGNIDLTLAFGERNATLVLKTAWRQPPAYVEWNLPMPIQTAGGDEKGVEVIDPYRVRFPSTVRRVVALW